MSDASESRPFASTRLDQRDPSTINAPAAESFPVLDAATSCCGGLGSWMTLQRLSIVVLATISLVAVASSLYFAGVASEARRQAWTGVWSSNLGSTAQQHTQLSDLPVANAASAIRDENYSMATGPVSEQAEGLFVLDHNSGVLQCTVIYPRMARFLATYTVNVADALGTGAKGGTYLMSTGTVEFNRGSNNPAALSAVYVLDSATGNYACYGIPFDRVQMNANRPQQGLLVLIATGSANPVVDRDELR